MESLRDLGFDPGALLMNIFGFLVLLFFFRKYLYGPISDFMGQRTQDIQGQIDQARKLHEEARQTHDGLQTELAAEREAARGEIAGLTQEAKAAIQELHNEARKQRQEMLEQGRLELERSKEAALAELKQHVAGMAVDISAKVIREALDEQRQAALVDEFLRDVERAGGRNQTN